jgi:hypothetical protein
MDRYFIVRVDTSVTGLLALAAAYLIVKNCLGHAVGCNGAARNQAGDALANALPLIFLLLKAHLIALKSLGKNNLTELLS